MPPKVKHLQHVALQEVNVEGVNIKKKSTKEKVYNISNKSSDT